MRGMGKEVKRLNNLKVIVLHKALGIIKEASGVAGRVDYFLRLKP